MNFWLTPLVTPELQPGEIHIWQASLEATDQITRLLPLLSDDEQTRAGRFHFQKDRDRFVIARGVLRVILSQYLDIQPQDLKFQYSEMGKPSLTHFPELCFNVSHSGQIALYAVAQSCEVGIDVEQIRPERDWEAIATRFFSTQEQTTLKQLSPDLKLQGFFNCWTRKEALLKAIGQGLRLPLDQFTVSLTPGEPARLLQVEWNLTQRAEEWWIEALPVAAGYAAAVAAGCPAIQTGGQLAGNLKGWQFELRQFQ